MFHLHQPPRKLLVASARALLNGAHGFRDHPKMAQALDRVDCAITQFLTAMHLRKEAASQLAEHSTAARTTEECLDAQVTGLCQNLQAQGKIGDAAASAAARKLFPKGSGVWVKATGRSQLALYEDFTLDLGSTALPSSMLELAQQIQQGIRSFKEVMASKELARLQLSQATKDVSLAEDALKRALEALEKEADYLLSPEEWSDWVRPLKDLARKKEQKGEEEGEPGK